jgi:hypothetical protein
MFARDQQAAHRRTYGLLINPLSARFEALTAVLLRIQLSFVQTSGTAHPIQERLNYQLLSKCVSCGGRAVCVRDCTGVVTVPQTGVLNQPILSSHPVAQHFVCFRVDSGNSKVFIVNCANGVAARKVIVEFLRFSSTSLILQLKSLPTCVCFLLYLRLHLLGRW